MAAEILVRPLREERRDMVSARVEPLFLLSNEQGLNQKPEGLPGERYFDYLSQMVRRRPQELSLHIRRINAAQALQDQDRVAAAMLDMFIVLGAGGRDLKIRMLRHAAPAMHPGHVQVMRSILEGDSSAQAPGCHMHGSVLSYGLTGQTDLLTRIEFGDDRVMLSYQLIKEFHRQGLIESACDLLQEIDESILRQLGAPDELIQLKNNKRPSAV